MKVLGWTPAKGACALAACNGTGTFVGNFTDQTAGKTITAGDFAAKADIVFPVAGSVGLGSVAAAKQAGAGHNVMWVDTNGCVSDAADCTWFDRHRRQGRRALGARRGPRRPPSGTFKGGTYLGTLKNQGTRWNTAASWFLPRSRRKIADRQGRHHRGQRSR